MGINIELESKIREKLKRSTDNVFLRKDFDSMAGYAQVGRCLSDLVEKGVLARIGHGIYAKARPNRISNEIMLAAPGGFDQVAKEALTRLGIEWGVSDAERSYQQGSTQVPARACVQVPIRTSRKLQHKKHRLIIDHKLRA